MLIVAIDPGYEISAYIEWNGQEISKHGIINNSEVIQWLRDSKAQYLFIEKIVCMGQPIGKETLDTVFWSGIFYQVWQEKELELTTDISDSMIPRTTIKGHFRVSNDAQIRKKLIEKYGKQLTKNLKSHLWQAFALAAWVTETNFLENE